MKPKLYLVLAGFLLLSMQLKAQAPNAFNYQGVARDALGNQLQNQLISLRFTIHQSSFLGATVYRETDSVTTNQFGLFTVAIGSGTVVSGNMATISWGTNTYYLQVEMDPSGGINYTDLGAQQLLSVPYALYAESAGSGGAKFAGGAGITINDSLIEAQVDSALWNANKLQGDSISIIAPTAGQVLQWNGTAWVATSFLSGSNDWALTGDSISTTFGTNFLGTTNDAPLEFKVDNKYAGAIDNDDSSVYLGLGTGSSDNTFGGKNIQNTAIGYQALASSKIGANTAIGYQALYNFTGVGGTGFPADNVAVGWQSNYGNVSGGENTSVGDQTLFGGAGSNGNTAIGYQAEYSPNGNTGGKNTAIGADALTAISSGSENTASGVSTMTSMIDGSDNTSAGANALNNSNGSRNTAIGALSL